METRYAHEPNLLNLYRQLGHRAKDIARSGGKWLRLGQRRQPTTGAINAGDVETVMRR